MKSSNLKKNTAKKNEIIQKNLLFAKSMQSSKNLTKAKTVITFDLINIFAQVRLGEFYHLDNFIIWIMLSL